MFRFVKYILILILTVAFSTIATAQCSLEITSQPSFSDIVCAGPGSERLSVSAKIVTDGTISYQWYLNGTKITNAVSSSYTIGTLQTSSNGNYSVVVQGTCGTSSQSLTSSTATLQVANTPLIVSLPSDQSVCIGNSLDLSVLGNSRFGGALTYEWKNVNTNQVVSTNAAYSIASFGTSNQSPYTVSIQNSCGTTSASFTLSKKDKPTTAALNSSTTISSCVGSAAVLETQTTDNNGGNTSYEWYKIVSDVAQLLPGATLSYLSFPAVSNADAGVYRVFSRNTCGRSATPLDFTLSTPKNKPTIVAQPSYADINCSNYELQITTTCFTESGSLNFSWKKDGGSVSTNATISSSNAGKTSTLSILQPATSDNGSYQVFVSNGCGTIQTNALQVKINVIKPKFSLQPVAAYICENSSFSSEPTISEEALYNYTYAWYKDGSGSSIAATKKIDFNSFVEANNGKYQLYVIDACGTVVKSDIVAFSLVKNPVIVTQPSSGASTVCMNQDVSLQVGYKQEYSGVMEYQWFNNDNILNGEINARLNLNKITYVGQGSYRVQLKNQCGIAQSNSVPITLGAAPTYISKTTDTLFCIGSKMMLNVEANTNNGGQLRYRWTSSSKGLLSNETNSYTLNNFTSADAATYQIQVSNSCGSIADPINIKVSSSTTPVINSFSSTTKTPCVGNKLDFNVVTQGVVTKFLWFRSNTQISSGESFLQIPNTTFSDAGAYKVIASNLCGSSTSDEILITINDKPTIIKQPQSSINCTTDRTLSLTTNGISNGGGAITYQWYKNAKAIAGGSNAILSFTGIDETYNGSYNVVLSNTCGSINSDAVNVVLDFTIPEILRQPQDQTVCSGSPFLLNLKIKDEGTKTFTYQWVKDGTDIPGAKSSVFSNEEAVVSNQGQYRVKITGLCGLSAASSLATILVNEKPTPIFTIISKTSQCIKGNVFEFTDLTSGSFNREWFFDDGNSTVNSTNVKHSYQKDGIYAVMLKLTSAKGCAATITKNITVATVPSIINQLQSATACLNGDYGFNINASDNFGGTIKYEWKKDNTTISWAPTTTGNLTLNGIRKSDEGFYSVKISNSCGYINGDSAYLTVADKPVFLKDISAKAVCVNTIDTVFTKAISAMQSITYSWYRNDALFKTTTDSYLPFSNFSDEDAGKYYVIAKNSCGATSSNTFPLNLKLKPIWMGKFSRDTTCFNSIKLIEARFSSNLNDDLEYQWYKNDTIMIGEKAPVIKSLISQPGEIKFRLNVTNSCGYVEQLVRTTFTNIINAQFRIDTVDACRTQLKMSIKNNSEKSVFKLYNWQVDYGDGFRETKEISDQNTFHQFEAPGIYNVTLTVTDESGCISQPIIKQYYNYGKSKSNFYYLDTCLGQETKFFNTTALGYGSNAYSFYQWVINGDTLSVDPAKTVLTKFKSPGAYKATLYTMGNKSCLVDTIQLIPHVIGYPTANFTYIDSCASFNVLFADKSKSALYDTLNQWQWYFQDGTPPSFEKDPIHVFKKAGSYKVNLSVQSKACPAFVDDTTINLNIIRARDNKRYTTFYSVQSKLDILSSNPGGRSYLWSPQFNLNNATIASPTLNPDFSKREYIVKITDSSGCINMDSLLVYGFKQAEIYLPTAFSPNLDGNNDVYKPEYVYIKSLEYFTILDQFNNKVFETKDLATYWDGKFNGKILPSGTYLVIASAIDKEGNRIQRKNTFILLR